MSRVSIITPSYNQADYLEQAVLTVLAQDYPDVEYILVDGGSSDGSVEIIKRYQDRLTWWVSEADHGQADAIMKGFEHASGEIIAWLNSDDIYLPGAVNQAVSALQANPDLGMVYGDAITIDKHGSPLNRLAFDDLGLIDLVSFRIICQPAVFMRRSVFEQTGGLNPDYHFMLDHHLWVRMAQIAPIQHIARTWAAARHHATAKNVSQSGGFAQETQQLLAWMVRQPDLAAIIDAHQGMVYGGAYRLSARYLLDGGQPSAALRTYLKAFKQDPGYALQHWHRMLFSLISMLGGARLADDYYRIRRNRVRSQSILDDSQDLAGWPGLQLPGQLEGAGQ